VEGTDRPAALALEVGVERYVGVLELDGLNAEPLAEGVERGHWEQPREGVGRIYVANTCEGVAGILRVGSHARPEGVTGGQIGVTCQAKVYTPRPRRPTYRAKSRGSDGWSGWIVYAITYACIARFIRPPPTQPATPKPRAPGRNPQALAPLVLMVSRVVGLDLVSRFAGVARLGYVDALLRKQFLAWLDDDLEGPRGAGFAFTLMYGRNAWTWHRAIYYSDTWRVQLVKGRAVVPLRLCYTSKS